MTALGDRPREGPVHALVLKNAFFFVLIVEKKLALKSPVGMSWDRK